MSAVEQELYALETRAEGLALVSSDAAVRRGESDRFELGSRASSDVVNGQEASNTGGDYAESAHTQLVRAARMETCVDGKMTVEGHSDTTLLGGAMTETHAGPALLLAGMSDALVAGGGMRATVADLAVAGLIGFEEKVGSAAADGALVEAYATHFEREYGPGSHVAGFASFSGTVHITSASGFRPLFKVASGVRNLAAGGGGGAGPEGPAGSTGPPPPVPPRAPSGGASQGLIGDTPSVGDALRHLEDSGVYEDIVDADIYTQIPAYAEAADGRVVLDSSFYDYVQVRGARRPLADGAGDAPNTANAADVLASLRAAAEQGGYNDVQRGQILNLLSDVERPPLSGDVDRSAVIAELDRLLLEAGADGVLDTIADTTAPAQFQAEQLEAAQLYALARTSLESSEDPQRLLDYVVSVYRWRAENGLEAYPNQADVVEEIRLGIDDVLRHNGYEGPLAGADEGLESDLVARLDELFGSADETVGAGDEAALRAEDASALSAMLDDLDDAARSNVGGESALGRDPRDLTVRELEGFRVRDGGSWNDLLGRSAKPPAPDGADDFRSAIPLRTELLEDWDEDIVTLVGGQHGPALAGDGNARAALIADLQAAEDAARLKVDKAWARRNAVAADVALDQMNVYALAKEAVQNGEHPLPGLNELVEIYRWRDETGFLTYTDQVRIFEDARDDVALLFHNRGFTSTDLPELDLLTQAYDLFDPARDVRVLEDASDGRTALAGAGGDLIGDLRADRVADAVADQGGAAEDVRWGAQSADADALMDLSTEDAVRSASSGEGGAHPALNVGDEAHAPLNLGSDTGQFDWLLGNVVYERTDRSWDANPFYDEAGGFYSNAGADRSVEGVRASAPLPDYAEVDETRQVDRLQQRTRSLPDMRSAPDAAGGTPGRSVDDFVRGADSMPFGLNGDVGRPSADGGPADIAALYAQVRRSVPELPPRPSDDVVEALLRSTSPVAAGSRPTESALHAQPVVLQFLSDDAARLVGVVPEDDLGGTKFVFQLSDSELEALQAGDLVLSIKDPTSFDDLGPAAFEIVGGGPVRAVEQADLRVALGASIDVSTSGYSISTRHGGGRLLAVLPAVGGAVRIRERPASLWMMISSSQSRRQQ